MFFKRALPPAAAFSLALVLFGDANGQLIHPENSLRRTSEQAMETLNSTVDLSAIFDVRNIAKINFELRFGAIADAVITDQQLADFVFASNSASDGAQNETDERHSQYVNDTDLIYDTDVRQAVLDEASGEGDSGGFSAFSDVEVASFDKPIDTPMAADEPVLAEAMPDSGAALPQPQPQPDQALIGPAYPANLAVDTPIARQMIGELLEGIQRHKNLLKSTNENGDEEYDRRSKLLDQSNDLLMSAKKYFKKDLIQSNSIKTFEADKKILQEKLAIDRKSQLPQDDASAEDLFARLDSLRNEMEALNARVHELSKVELQHKVRLGEIPKDRADARKSIAELDKRLKNEELDQADTYVMIRLRAEELELEYFIDSLDSESKLYELQNRILPLQNDLLARELKVLDAEITSWNFAANQRRRQDLEEEARLARAKVIDAAPSLRELATLNAELTERRIKFTEQIRAATEEEIEVKELLNKVNSQHESVEKSIIDNTLSHADGMMLVDVRRKMIRPFKSHRRIRQINRELQQISLERIKLNEQREPLSHPAEYAAEMLKDVHADSISDEQLSAMAIEIVESIRQQYDQLSSDHHAYIDVLGKIVVEREQLVSEIEATMDFVNQNSLWVRSAQPLSVEQITKSRFALKKFFSLQQWTELLGCLTFRCLHSPHESAAGLIGLVSLFIFSRRFKP